MKRLIALMMALAMITTFAACAQEDNQKNKHKRPAEETTEVVTEDTVETESAEVEDTEDEITEDEITEPEGAVSDNTGSDSDDWGTLEIDANTKAVDVLTAIWEAMGGERQPASFGGHISEENMGGPYTYDLSYAEDLAATLLLPEDQMDKVIDAATVVHMLNANSMTAGVLKMKEGTDVQAFAKAVSERISGNQWMCGFPEKMAIIQIDEDYLFVAYGLLELIDPMVDNMDSSWTVNALYNQILE